MKMKIENRTWAYLKLFGRVFGGPLILAVGLLCYGLLWGGGWELSEQTVGVTRELLNGTTVGRQALFGSFWTPPLPLLVYLPFAWLCTPLWAAWLAFITCWTFTFWALSTALCALNVARGRIWLGQLALLALVGVNFAGSAAHLELPLTLGLTLISASALAGWAQTYRVRDLVVCGMNNALLLLCGSYFILPVLVSTLLIPLFACSHKAMRQRWHAWILLAWLPVFYVLGVWLLLNRLILGDAYYFIRSLAHLALNIRALVVQLLWPSALWVVILGLLFLAQARRRNNKDISFVAPSVLICFAMMLYFQAHVWERHQLGWQLATLHLTWLAIFVLVLTTLRQSWLSLLVMLGLLAGLSSTWIPAYQVKGSLVNRAKICQDVEEYVAERTAYGSVFALGYSGLALLNEYQGTMLKPNLDLHLADLRQTYKGHNIYLLIPSPRNLARTESVFWRYPDIYQYGAERLLYAAQFDTWRLFEVISAPTQEQLDEWRAMGEE